jgi:16S rRNA (cytosine1402-N4)-methyltransferase
MQLDQEKRGFSFLKEGPLDMRMDPSSDLTAKEIVNRWSEKDLGQLFREYGEERRWKQVAKAIVRARQKKSIETTTELAEIISSSVRRGGRGKLHPATLVFQALRICVNKELEAIQDGVSKALHFLSSGGRIGVLSFHRLEDRIVKNIFRSASRPIKQLGDVKDSHYFPLMRLLTKTPLVPTRKECKENRRARSAKLRVAERL